MGDTAPATKPGGQLLYRCPLCGSLVDNPGWRCWHGPDDMTGNDRVPVWVTVEPYRGS